VKVKALPRAILQRRCVCGRRHRIQVEEEEVVGPRAHRAAHPEDVSRGAERVREALALVHFGPGRDDEGGRGERDGLPVVRRGDRRVRDELAPAAVARGGSVFTPAIFDKVVQIADPPVKL